MPKEPKNPLKGVRKALGIKEDAKDEPEDEEQTESTQAEAKSDEEQESEEEPKQVAPKEAPAAPQETKPVPIPVDEILDKTNLLPIVIKAKFIPEIHYFLVVPVKDDEHKLLLGYTMGEKDPVLKLQCSGNAIANLKLALQKA